MSETITTVHISSDTSCATVWSFRELVKWVSISATFCERDTKNVIVNNERCIFQSWLAHIWIIFYHYSFLIAYPRATFRVPRLRNCYFKRTKMEYQHIINIMAAICPFYAAIAQQTRHASSGMAHERLSKFWKDAKMTLRFFLVSVLFVSTELAIYKRDDNRIIRLVYVYRKWYGERHSRAGREPVWCLRIASSSEIYSYDHWPAFMAAEWWPSHDKLNFDNIPCLAGL